MLQYEINIKTIMKYVRVRHQKSINEMLYIGAITWGYLFLIWGDEIIKFVLV